jgi:hypothetical protein
MPAESPLVAERIGKQLSISEQMKIFMKCPVIKAGRQTLSLHRGPMAPGVVESNNPCPFGSTAADYADE